MDITALEKQLPIDEGKSLKVYLDTEGLPTVGIGHLVRPEDNLKLGDVITEERCSQLFKQEVDIAVKSCYKLIPNFTNCPEEVKQIVCNMMFNLGPTRLAGFKKFLAAIKAKNYQEAANQMESSKWYKQVGDRSKRLVRRMRAIQ